MAATIKQYALNVYSAQAAVARKMGLDIDLSASEVRVLALSGAVILGVVLNRLETNGALTAAQLQQTINQVLAADFPLQPTFIPRPEDNQAVPPPDLGA